MTTALGNRQMLVALAVLALFLSVAAILPLLASSASIAQSSELGFTSLSPRGASGGSIIPASCESGFAHNPGDCNAPPPPPPATPTASLWADPATIDSGQSSQLFWTSTNATSCVSAGGFDTGGATTNPPGGVSTGVLTQTTSYQITCTKPNGAFASSLATVTVLQPTVTIVGDPDRVNTGTGGGGGGGGGGSAITTVSWNATNVNACTITRNGATWKVLTADAERTVSGSSVDTVTTQTLYRISCTNNASGNGAAAIAATEIVNVVSSFQEF